MTVRIDLTLCNGCTDRPESICEEICPGDLLYRKDGKAFLREPSDCWDCFACVKECPSKALSIELPFQISESRQRLTACMKENSILWRLVDQEGKDLAKYLLKNRVISKNNK